MSNYISNTKKIVKKSLKSNKKKGRLIQLINNFYFIERKREKSGEFNI
jgi:hypothetical protein